MKKHVSYKKILREIQENFQQIEQWNKYDKDYAIMLLDYTTRATCLIELLETERCGSVGGYDKGQPRGQNLMERFEWLCHTIQKK